MDMGEDGIGPEAVPEPSPRLRATMWRFDPANPTALLSGIQQPRRNFEIDNCVLCSEMGLHFSPCGQMLVACVACRVRARKIGLAW
jgi:activator-of-BECN1-regulated-autophagy protein 1